MSINLNELKMKRSLEFESEVKDDEYLYSITFATDKPVSRWFGQEIVNPALMDLSRLNNRAIVLFNHDFNKPVGVVEKAWIEVETNLAKAEIRLDSTNEEALKIKKSIDNKVINKISFGYQYLDSKLIKTENNEDYYEFATLPYEISIVTVPADDSVGFEKRSFEEEFLKKNKIAYNDSRNLNLDKQKMKTETEQEAQEAQVQQVQGEVKAEVAQEVKTLDVVTSLLDAKQIRELGDLFNKKALADEYILNSKSLAEFKQALQKETKTEVKQIVRESEKMTTKNLIETLKDAKERGLARLDLNLKDFSGVTKVTHGKELTQEKTGSILDFTAFEDYYRSLGFTVYNSVKGNLTFPYISDINGGSIVAEGELIPQGQIVSSQVKIEPKKFAVQLKISEELLNSTNENLIDLIEKQGLAKARDAISQDILSSLVKTAGIKTEQKDFTFENLVGLQADVNTSGDKRYLTTRKTSVALKTKEAFAGTGRTVLEGGYIDGIKTEIVEKLPGDVSKEFVLFGDLSANLVALYGDVQAQFNPYIDINGLYTLTIICEYGSKLANVKAVTKLEAN